MTGATRDHVFISHAKADKARISPIVETLVRAGLRVWLDHPHKLNCPREIKTLVDGLSATKKSWPDELSDAAEAAGCVLVCFSNEVYAKGPEAFTGRLEWHAEIVKGEKKAVFIAVDDIDTSKMGARYNVRTIRRRTLENGWDDGSDDTLLKDVRTVLAAGAKDLAESSDALAFDLTMAGRDREEVDIVGALVGAHVPGAVRLLILTAPANELPELFVRRLNHRLTKHLNTATWHQEDVDWPEPHETFRERYLNLLGTELRAQTRSITQIATELERRPEPTAILHRLHSNDWTSEEPKRIRAWVEIWRELAKAAPKSKLMPILLVSLPDARPGWQRQKQRADRVPGAGWWNLGSRAPHIWRSLLALEAEYRQDELQILSVAPVLPPIEHNQAMTWAGRADRTATDVNAKTVAVTRLFQDEQTRKSGVEHQRFMNHFQPKP